ncbi:hypothetical protein NDU88_001297 [Pleurodeles waltl]|uniref:Uncharacterized protein n=1 Tax=Pleurodeles waltl TaxID=8319 RepID=A0AAV7SB82_PLEWA|nr:hypothetical protein NDU88_001297 [Pleurodeles waltl]
MLMSTLGREWVRVRVNPAMLMSTLGHEWVRVRVKPAMLMPALGRAHYTRACVSETCLADVCAGLCERA